MTDAELLQQTTALTVEQALQQAVAHHQAGQLQDAERLYRSILQIQPNHPDALHFLGLIAYQVKNYPVASELMDRAIAVNPSNPLYYSNRGLVSQVLGEQEKAVEYYRQAISMKPEFADAHYNLGVAMYSMGKFDLAVESYRRSIQLLPQFHGNYYNLGIVLKDQGKLAEALDCFEQALAIQPDLVEPRLNLANTLHAMNRFEEAAVQIKVVINTKSDISHLAAFNYGNWLSDRSFQRESVFYYQQAFAQRVGVQQAEDTELSSGLANAYFELTNKCNFHCDFCPSDSQKRSTDFMSLRLVKRLYDEVAEKNLVPKVNLHLMGEPTLHPDLTEVLAYASAKNVKTELVTNGSTLTEKIASKILDALNGVLAVSLQTPTKSTFKHRGNCGLDWDRYIGNIRLLVREHLHRVSSLHPSRSTIELRVMVTKNSKLSATIIETVEDIKAVWSEWSLLVAETEKELGMPVFHREIALPQAESTNPVNLRIPLQQGLTLTFWQGFTFANAMLSKDYQLESKSEAAFCSRPFIDVAVLASGDVTLCCLDYDGRLAVGNIYENSIEGVLSNQATRTLRGAMLGRSPLPPFCQQCQAKATPLSAIK